MCWIVALSQSNATPDKPCSHRHQECKPRSGEGKRATWRQVCNGTIGYWILKFYFQHIWHLSCSCLNWTFIVPVHGLLKGKNLWQMDNWYWHTYFNLALSLSIYIYSTVHLYSVHVYTVYKGICFGTAMTF